MRKFSKEWHVKKGELNIKEGDLDPSVHYEGIVIERVTLNFWVFPEIFA